MELEFLFAEFISGVSCINILGIKTFLAIVETNSLAKAAEKLFLSQSTVSYRLNELEQELGIQLIMREQGKRFITLTREGEEFIAIAERWLSLERDTDDWKNKGQDNMYLKIGSVDSLNSYIFPPLFRSIISGDNPFTINVSSHWTFTVYNLLKNYELDLGLVLGIINFSDILSYPVFQEKLVLATYDYSEKFTGKEEISPCTLDPENEIYVNWGTDYVSWHDKWWDPTKRKNLVVDTAGLVMQFLKISDYWSIVPLSIGSFLQKNDKDIKLFEISEPKPKRICYLVKHRYPKLSSTKAIEVFEEQLDIFIKGCSFLNTSTEIE